MTIRVIGIVIGRIGEVLECKSSFYYVAVFSYQSPVG